MPTMMLQALLNKFYRSTDTFYDSQTLLFLFFSLFNVLKRHRRRPSAIIVRQKRITANCLTMSTVVETAARRWQ